MVDLHVLVDTIQRLSKSPEFQHMFFTVCGNWSHFEEVLFPLRKYDNVVILDKGLVFEPKSEMYQKNAIFGGTLRCRFPWWCVSRGYGMWPLPVVSDLGAVREIGRIRVWSFPHWTPIILLRASFDLINDSDRFLKMSGMAHVRCLELRGSAERD
jgi:hypothetical protein